MLGRIFKQKDEITAGYSRDWFQNASSLRQIVFDSLESAIIVAALQAAWEKTGQIAFCVLWLVAFCVLTLYLQVLVRYVINEVNDRFELIKNRTAFAYVAGTGSLLFTAFSVNLVSSVTSAFIKASFMQ
ncbi:hypothetical protein [Rhizobium sp.]|uniref:hypothetical protein n=1 Tax=Rhizobium sp. TaxID=391 RepID=UPI0034C6D623